MPTLILKPFYEIPINKAQEKQIIDFLESDEFTMTVNDTTFSRSSFAYIKPGGLTAVDVFKEPIDPGRRLKSDNRSHEEQYKAARRKAEAIKETLHRKSYDKLNLVKGDQKNER